MHVPSYPRVVALLLMLAGFAGGAQAVEFDEKLKAPMVKGADRAEDAGARVIPQASRALQRGVAAGNGHATRRSSLEHFDLKWQISTRAGRQAGRWEICRRSVS